MEVGVWGKSEVCSWEFGGTYMVSFLFLHTLTLREVGMFLTKRFAKIITSHFLLGENKRDVPYTIALISKIRFLNAFPS